MPRTGRRPGEPATRERIATAARSLFAEHGFRGTSIRAIAFEAQVDPALVHHYFGSKRALFLSVIRLPLELWDFAEGRYLTDRDRIGEEIVRFGLQIWDDADLRPALLGILRSAVTDPQAAALLRDLFSRQGPANAIRAVAPDEPELRAQLAISHMVGLAMARHILAAEPLASTDAERLIATIGPAIQGYVTGPLPAGDKRPRRRPASRSDGPG